LTQLNPAREKEKCKTKKKSWVKKSMEKCEENRKKEKKAGKEVRTLKVESAKQKF
jgi:hypothetical protein